VNWKIPYFRHDLGQVEVESLASVLKGDILTTGEAVSAFEAKFASYLGQRHALGVTSCTGALHMALLALDIGPGDEVIEFRRHRRGYSRGGGDTGFCRRRTGYRQSRSASR
jgi:dTDP-4-amino-4,6-dideoxygalactose transaminase